MLGLSIEQWQLLVSAAGLFALLGVFRQIQLARALLDQTAKWNKIVTYHSHFSDCPPIEVRQLLDEQLKKFDEQNGTNLLDAIRDNEAVSVDDAKKLCEDKATLGCVLSYLDAFEELCGAIEKGAIDHDYVVGLEMSRIKRAFKVYREVIELRRGDGRKREKFSHAYDHLQCVAERLESLTDEQHEEISRRNRISKSV